MAVTTQIITDTRYRTNVKYLCDNAANANVELLDVSDLMGFAAGGKVNLAKIYWTSSGPAGGLNILWDAGTNVTGFICEGTSGTYGYMPGQPGIAQPMPLAGSATGDVLVTNATATFTLVIEYHKIEATVGHGNGWTGND